MSVLRRRITDLERSAGVRLLEKKPEGYELTVAGQDVFESARELETIVTALERRVHALADAIVARRKLFEGR